MQQVNGIAVFNNRVWAASTGGLFSFDCNNPGSSINSYTTLNGLLSNELVSATADNIGNIWSGGSDGSINVFTSSNSNWRVISDILNSTETSKSIHDIFQYNNFMFIATDFSIIKFNISLFQMVDQPYINLGPLIATKTPVYQTMVVNDTIWAATKNGIAYANINNNLPIPTSWSDFTRANSILNFLGTNKINTVCNFNGKMYFGTDSGMVFYDGTSLQIYQPSYNNIPIIHRVITHMVTSGSSMYISADYGSSSIYKVDQADPNTAQLVYSGNEVEALKIFNDALLIGTLYNGVDIFRNNTHSYTFPNGPFSNLFSNMAVDGNDNLWAVSGSLGDWSHASGVYKFNEKTWKNYTVAEYPAIGWFGSCCGYVQVYPSRYNSVIWVSGFGQGLLKIDGDNITRYIDSNSILKHFENNFGFVLVEGVKEDNNGDLWVINRAPVGGRPIVNFTRDTAYPVPGSPGSTTLINMVIDNYNTKWITLPGDAGVVYFNENLVPSGNIIPTSQLGADISAVNNIALDKNGEVWIATNNGIAIVQDPYQVIQNPGSIPSTYKMRIIENGISTPLVESVQAIAVDALNNKWIGTLSNGVIYVSSDGSTLLNRFNTANSPLPDNKINCIAVSGKTGKVFFGTQKGVVSYQTLAVEPLTACDKITAGPNPYLIPNDKLLRIDGLVEGSSIKILSISGILVSQFDSPGGRIANWDGRDLRGSYVPSGIYIIVGYNKDGSLVCTGKVAVVRK
jgi:ligand-binding sensor domain-containing protein